MDKDLNGISNIRNLFDIIIKHKLSTLSVKNTPITLCLKPCNLYRLCYFFQIVHNFVVVTYIYLSSSEHWSLIIFLFKRTWTKIHSHFKSTHKPQIKLKHTQQKTYFQMYFPINNGRYSDNAIISLLSLDISFIL